MAYRDSILTDAPFGYWQLSSDIDLGQGGNRLLYQNAPTIAGLLAEGGLARSFDGSTSYAQTKVLDYTGLTVGQSRSFDAVVHPNPSAGAGVILELADGTPGVLSWGPTLGMDGSGHAYVRAYDTAWRIATGTTDIRAGTHHVAARYDSSAGKISIWVDGSKQTETTVAAVVLPTLQQVSMGMGAGLGTAPNPPPQYFSGSIDDIAYYLTALADARITAHATASTTSAGYTVTSVAPASANNSTAQTVAVSGSGFTNTSVVVLINTLTAQATPLVTTFTAANLLHATVPYLMVHGIYDVQVQSSTGSSNTLLVGYVITRKPITVGRVNDIQVAVQRLPPFFDYASLAVPIIKVTPNPLLSFMILDGGRIRLVDTSDSGVVYHEFDLAAEADDGVWSASPQNPLYLQLMTVTDVLAWLQNLGYAPQLLDYRYAELDALILLPQTQPGQNLITSPYIQAFTSLTWTIMAAFAQMLGKLSQDTEYALAQLDMHTASGYWLDRWGAIFGLPRDSGASDDTYRQLLTLHTQLPWSSLHMLQTVLNQGWGFSTTVVDVGQATFMVTHSVIPAGYTEASLLAATRIVCNRYKAVGTTYVIRIVTSIYLQDSANVFIREAFNRFAQGIAYYSSSRDGWTASTSEHISIRRGPKPPDV